MSCTATQHGTATAYNRRGCRCPQGREAWRLYNKRRREGRNPAYFLPSIGYARRLQALVALGYTYRALAGESGHDLRTIERIAHGKHPVVAKPTARRISEMYERLSTTPGGSQVALRVAARYGWVPPLAWDDIDDPNAQPDLGDPNAEIVDEVAIRRALAGERIRLTRAEKLHAFRTGYDAGMTTNAIATALHLSGAKIQQLAAQARTEQAA